MSKRFLLSGYYGFENFGDELILEVMVRMLKSFGVDPIVLSEDPQSTSQTYQVESIPRMDVPLIWKTMDRVAGLISGGGGLFQDITGPGSPLYYGGLIEMAHWRKLLVCIFGQGIGPIKTPLGRFITARAIRHADLVVVRDVKSQAWVTRMAQTKSEVMADPVWMWQPSAEMQALTKNGLGVSLRTWPELQDPEIQRIADCITQLPTIQEVGVNLIDCQAGMDIIPLAKLEQRLKGYGIPCRWFSGQHAIQGIAQSTALMAMRYHAVLIGAQMGLPQVTLSYDPKVQMLGSQLKLQDYPVSALEELTASSFREHLRRPDEAGLNELRQSAREGFNLLKTWLGH